MAIENKTVHELPAIASPDGSEEIAAYDGAAMGRVTLTQVATFAGSGDVVGPGSSTDNAIARFDSTTGKLLQNSGVTIDDSGNIATSGTVDGRDVSELAMTLISSNTLSSATSSVILSSIPATYKHLILMMSLRTDRASYPDDAFLRFNSDTSGNYDYQRLYGSGSTVTASASGGSTGVVIGACESNGASWSNSYSAFVINVLDYADSSKRTQFKSSSTAFFTGTSYAETVSGLWDGTAAVSSITITPLTGTNLVSGSEFQLYGVK